MNRPDPCIHIHHRQSNNIIEQIENLLIQFHLTTNQLSEDISKIELCKQISNQVVDKLFSLNIQDYSEPCITARIAYTSIYHHLLIAHFLRAVFNYNRRRRQEAHGVVPT